MIDNSLPGVDLLSFFFGFLASGLVGLIFQKIRTQRGIMKAPGRPMAVLTKKTPNEVQKDASRAFWRYLGWMLILVVVVVILFMIVAFLSIPY